MKRRMKGKMREVVAEVKVGCKEETMTQESKYVDKNYISSCT
jgi:hypothetical protein